MPIDPSPLGTTRLTVLACLGGDMPASPGFFAPAPGEEIFAAFARHVATLVTRFGPDENPLSRSLLGAARLVVGDLTGADAILDHLPPAPYPRDHGAGRCLTVPQRTMVAVLPLPPALAGSAAWLAGSATQRELRDWLAAHRGALRWSEPSCVYRFEVAGGR